MSTKVILVGGFSETVALCEDCDITIVGIIDKSTEPNIMGYPVLGTDDDARMIFNDYKNIPVVVSPDLPKIRKKLVDYYRNIGFGFRTVIARNAMVSKYAKIANGVIIHSGAHVSAMAEIKPFVRINALGNVMHDCVVGSFSTIAPNSVLLGHVKIGDEVYVGANSTILPHVAVEDSAVIGAGAVVTKNVAAGKTVKGVPAK